MLTTDSWCYQFIKCFFFFTSKLVLLLLSTRYCFGMFRNWRVFLLTNIVFKVLYLEVCFLCKFYNVLKSFASCPCVSFILDRFFFLLYQQSYIYQAMNARDYVAMSKCRDWLTKLLINILFWLQSKPCTIDYSAVLKWANSERK